MKKMKVLFILFALSISNFCLAQGTKKALIIAVGDYPKDGLWDQISSNKDVPLIVNALNHHGFKKENMHILLDSSATKNGIIMAFQKMTQDAQKGDICVIHFSGHGQQMWDKNGDELDGKDETIVPFDAPKVFVKNQYEGERHLSDDELDLLVSELLYKLGKTGSLTMIFDACHSGTATRGMAKSRGTTEFMGPSDWEGKAGKDLGTYEFKVKSRGSGDGEMAPMVLFSGASASELNFETRDEQGNWVGSLSYSISKVLLNSDKNATYQEVFDQVRIEMSVIAARQNPQIEGDVNNTLFGGNGNERQYYFLNTTVLDTKTTIVNAGTLSGMFNKSKVGLYPITTKKTEGVEPIVTGRVTNANLVNADIIWDKEIDKEILRKNAVFILEQNMEDLHLKVKLDILSRPDLFSAIEENIKQYEEVLEINQESPEVMVTFNSNKSRGVAEVEIITSSELVITRENVGENIDSLAAVLTGELLNYAQAQFLRELDTKNDEIKLEVSLIPILETERVETREGRYKRAITIEKARGDVLDMTKDGMVELDSGAMFKIRVVNNGSRVAYFTILDITPTNQVGIVIPGKNQTPDEFKVRPGDTLELKKIYTIKPPRGIENFKLIATKEPMDLRQIVKSRGEGEASKGPLEKVIQKSYVTRSRGLEEEEEDIALPPDIANIHTLLFRIK